MAAPVEKKGMQRKKKASAGKEKSHRMGREKRPEKGYPCWGRTSGGWEWKINLGTPMGQKTSRLRG